MAKKKLENETETTSAFPEVEQYKLNPPCRFEIDVKQFDIMKISDYIWKETGRYWKSGKEILVIEVL